jgi:colanic acid/amylovoran biosynthesis protein
MRLLVEPSDYVLRNAGDMAMMYVAISRLAAAWPNALIQVLTADTNRLAEFCPAATPLIAPEPGKHVSENVSRRISPLARQLKELLLTNEAARRRLWPLIKFVGRARDRGTPSRLALPAAVIDSISRTDVMVVTGMGGITDAFPEYARGLLERIAQALAFKKPVFMLGQGIGPLHSPDLRSKAAAVLPHVRFIALREGRSGLPLLRSLGVPSHRMMVTGDDAIELANSSGSAKGGRGLGVNLRSAGYAATDSAFISECGEIVQRSARKFEAPMVPVPISSVPGEEDAFTIQLLSAGYPELLDGGMDLDTPLKVISQIKSCRIVFAGSYHAAVFSLSVGVPVVCFAKSHYYRDKFLGLAELFGAGCIVILACQPNWKLLLADVLERCWHSADELKPLLLAAAERQILLSRAAYQRVFEIMTATTETKSNF